jgi:hypothetical protein
MFEGESKKSIETENTVREVNFLDGKYSQEKTSMNFRLHQQNLLKVKFQKRKRMKKFD